MEKIYFFLNSYLGMYLTQSVFHSAVAAVLADCTIIAWGITSPARRQALRIWVILIPIAAFPVYQILDPERGDIYFRQDALMDTSGWLLMKLWGHLPVIVFFFIVLALTVFIFLFQELLPIIRHTAEATGGKEEGGGDDKGQDEGELPDRYDTSIIKALEGIPGGNPQVVVIDDEDLVVFSSTGRVPAVYVSTGLIDELDGEQLRGAIAHEIAHIRRTRRPVLTFLFVFRVLMFFNPVALFEFRRAVQDEEEICDDEAVRSTGDPIALSSALEKFLESHETGEEQGNVRGIEDYSHDMLLRKRISRLTAEGTLNADKEAGRFSLPVFILFTLAMNFFIV